MLSGSIYHLFNHANGRENLFTEQKNYVFFLERLSQHVLPIAHIYAYCLMPNHFHLLLKIRKKNLLQGYYRQKKEKQLAMQSGISVEIPQLILQEEELVKQVSKSFSNMFNSYTQAFNKMYNRMGSLFMQNMKREEVFDEESFFRLVYYIHNNPVRHRFVKKPDAWPHSSYKIFLSDKSTKLERDYVLKAFGGADKFIAY
ncbi:MAG: hypothetical protein AAB221_05295, partial [Bacteroidota bacterium]